MLARQRLQQFRESQSLSKSALARMLGVHPSYIGKVESGERKPKARFTSRLQTLTAQWKPGPICADEWIEDNFEVPELNGHTKSVAKRTGSREVRS